MESTHPIMVQLSITIAAFEEFELKYRTDESKVAISRFGVELEALFNLVKKYHKNEKLL